MKDVDGRLVKRLSPGGALPRLVRSKCGLILLLLLAVSVALTFSLRGCVPKSYMILDSDFRVLSISPHSSQGGGMEITPDGGELNNWAAGGSSIVRLHINGSILYAETNFTRVNVREIIWISRSLNVSLSQYPLFSARLLAPPGVTYSISFRGVDGNGARFEIRWPSPPVGNRRGLGSWEEVYANIKDLAYITTGRADLNVSEVTFYVEDSPIDVGHVCLMLGGFSFRPLPSLVEGSPSGASIYMLNISRYGDANFVPVHVRAYITVSGPENRYFRTYAALWHEGSLYVGEGSAYRFTSRPSYEVISIYPDRFVPYSHMDKLFQLSLTENPRQILLILVSDSVFGSLKVEKVLISYELSPYVFPSMRRIEPWLANDLIILSMTLLLALPLLVIAYIYAKNRGRERISGGLMLKLALVGLFLRLILAPLTGHSFDMEFWRSAAREYYESGSIHLETWPTMPLYLYMLLPSYSFYALARFIGFSDLRLLAHSTPLVESIFIKMPFILSDIASFILVMKILGGNNGLSGKHLFYGSLLLLNPFSIYLSGVWGMYDPIAACLLLASFHIFFNARRTTLALILCTLAGLTKPFGFFGLIILLIPLLLGRRFGEAAKALALCVPIAILSFLPMLLLGGIKEFTVHFIGRAALASRQVTSFGLSILGPPLAVYFVVMAAIILWYAYTVRGREITILDASFFTCLIFLLHYLSYPIVYAQHLFWALPFLIILFYLYGKDSFLAYILAYGFSPIIYYSSQVTIGYLFVGRRYYLSPLLDAEAATCGWVALCILGIYYVIAGRRSKWISKSALIEALRTASIYISVYIAAFLLT